MDWCWPMLCGRVQAAALPNLHSRQHAGLALVRVLYWRGLSAEDVAGSGGPTGGMGLVLCYARSRPRRRVVAPVHVLWETGVGDHRWRSAMDVPTAIVCSNAVITLEARFFWHPGIIKHNVRCGWSVGHSTKMAARTTALTQSCKGEFGAHR